MRPPRSAGSRTSSTARTTSASPWLLESVLFDRGWDATFEGEINGVIGSGLFVRFGEVFEGYVPVRRLGGDYYEVNELAGSRRAPHEADVPANDRSRSASPRSTARMERSSSGRKQPQLTEWLRK